jgi:hypothetical protein
MLRRVITVYIDLLVVFIMVQLGIAILATKLSSCSRDTLHILLPCPRLIRVMEHYVLGVIVRPCIHDTRHDAGTENIVTSIATVFGFVSLLFSPLATWGRRGWGEGYI